MELRWTALIVLVAAGAWLRLGARLDERRATLVALVAAGLVTALAAAGMAGRGVDLVDAYVLAGVGALAVSGRDAATRPGMGVMLALFGGALLAASAGGVAPPAAHLDLGPATLALTMAVAVGSLAALAVGRLARAGRAVLLVTVVALLVVFCVHRPEDTHPEWWGVLSGLRLQDAALYLFGPPEAGQLGQVLTVNQGVAGLLGLTAAAAVVLVVVLPRQRRLLCGLAALLTVGAGAVLVAHGLFVEVGEETQESLQMFAGAGLLRPAGSGPVFLDLASVLPALSAFCLAVGLLERAALGGTVAAPEVEDAVATDLDVAVAVGALLLGALIGVWREVWGTGLGEGSGPLLASLGAAVLGLRFGLPTIRAGAWGAMLLLVVGAGQLPAGVLPGLS